MRRFVLISLLVASGLAVAQQAARPALEKFHSAARLFFAGDTTAAAREARAGLAIDPRDPSLRALLAEIERRPPPQPSGGGGRDEPPPQPPNEPEEREEGSQGEEDSPQREPERPRDPGDDAEQEQAPARPGRDRPDGAGDDVAQAPQPGRMTREEAEALLRALGADERRLLRARRQNADDRQFENDW